MKRHLKAGGFFFKSALLPLACVCCLSCAAHTTNAVPQQNDRFLAEYSTIKKRLPLVERENDVLAKENDHYRQWVRDLESKIKDLTGELADAREAHANQIATKNEQIEQVEGAFRELSEESERQIASLNMAMASQQEDFIASRQQLIEENKRKQTMLSDLLAKKETQLKESTLKMAGLTTDLEKKDSQINELATLKAELEKTLKSDENKISELSAENEKTVKALTEANEMIASLKKARDKSMAELESAKSANAELVKTFNELFNQLQLEKDRSGTKI